MASQRNAAHPKSINCRLHILILNNRPCVLKVAFSQKGLMRLSFLQTGKLNYFPELEF